MDNKSFSYHFSYISMLDSFKDIAILLQKFS